MKRTVIMAIRALAIAGVVLCQGCVAMSYVSTIGLRHETATIPQPNGEATVPVTVATSPIWPGLAPSKHDMVMSPLFMMIPYSRMNEYVGEPDGTYAAHVASANLQQLNFEQDTPVSVDLGWHTATFGGRYYMDHSTQAGTSQKVLLTREHRRWYGYPAQALQVVALPVDVVIDSVALACFSVSLALH